MDHAFQSIKAITEWALFRINLVLELSMHIKLSLSVITSELRFCHMKKFFKIPNNTHPFSGRITMERGLKSSSDDKITLIDDLDLGVSIDVILMSSLIAHVQKIVRPYGSTAMSKGSDGPSTSLTTIAIWSCKERWNIYIVNYNSNLVM